jgi:transcription elongation factor Elf1
MSLLPPRQICNCEIDRKEGVANLVCKVCDQRYQSKANRKQLTIFMLVPDDLTNLTDLTEAIDVYSEWIDAADAAQKDESVPRRPVASSSTSRAPPAPALDDSGDEE